MVRYEHRLCKQDFAHRADDKQVDFCILIGPEEAFYNDLPEEMQKKLVDEVKFHCLTFAPVIHKVKKC